MAILLNDNINVETGKHLDNKYGPYADLATAKSSIPPFKRVRGLTVGIIDGSFLVEYWFKDGTNDSDLILKLNTSSFTNLSATNITVTNTVSAKFYQGTILDWMTLVRGYKTTPTLLQTIGGGEVYTYTFATAGADQTYYRYIATDGNEDSFYGNFSGGVLSNLIATKKIIL